ncbi:hypothetical protein [Minwuia thermotolerans]|uniref:Uncharacterized protein n=1 Tax=Minwuia thermotolerans TaxID=2056226 RepID=A0A2M9FZG3_9PROT|nr:hypothetical protein [Minwuia thermotolerans]PJK28814.1 hypothetical protein CVT23_15905 [Minwuia thermotolerans]
MLSQFLPPELLGDLQKLLEAEGNRVQVRARGAAIRSGVGLFAALLGFAALMFLGVGLYVHLTAHVSPLSAASIVAAGLAGVACLSLGLAMYFVNRRKALQAKARAEAARATVNADLLKLVGGIQATGVPPLALLAGALAVGVVSGMTSKDDQ